MHKYFEWVKIDSEISSWKSKGLYNKKVTYIVKSSKNQPPNIAYGNAMLFNGDPLKQNNVTYKHRPIVKIYIVHRLIPNTKNLFLPYKTVYLVQLNKKKMLILINTNILDVVLDLIQEEVLHIQVVGMVKMLLSLG